MRKVYILPPLLSHECLSAKPGLIGSLHVDLFRPLGRVGQDGDMIGTHFHKATANGNEFIFLPLTVDDQFPIGQRCHQRGMVR